MDTDIKDLIEQHPLHVAAKVKKWLRKNENLIQVFYLPSYSPDLNPVEKLNQDVKINVVGRRRPHTQEEMVRNV